VRRYEQLDKRKLDDTGDLKFMYYIKEAVIFPDVYIQSMLETITSYVQNFLKKSYNAKQITELLTRIFLKDKILFVLQSNIEAEGEVLNRSGFKQKTGYFLMFCNPNITNIQKDKESYKSFCYEFMDLIGHEMIHRIQYINSKEQWIVKLQNTKNPKKYLFDPHEIMAYAWQIIQYFKLQNYTNKQIKEILSSTNNEKLNCRTLKAYHYFFDKDSDVIKRLYKYMYQYLDEEI